MTRQEFTERTRVQVTEEQFAKINAVYMATDYSKDEFCQCYEVRMEDNPIVAEMIAKQEQFRLLYEAAMKKREDLARTILLLLDKCKEDELVEVAENILGKSAAIKFRIANEIDLTDSDLAYIAKTL